MHQPRNKSFLVHLTQSTLKISIGAFGLKAAYFAFNAALANATDIQSAGEYLRVIAFLTAYSSVVHFSTAKFVSKQIVEKSATAKGAFYFSLLMTVPGAVLVTLLCLQSIELAITIHFSGSYVAAFAYLFIAALFLGISDFLSLVGVGTGQYWRTVAAQLIKAVAFLLSALSILYNFPSAYIIGFALPIIASLIGIMITYTQLVPKTTQIVWPHTLTVINFALPLYIASFCINPASIWIVNNVAKLDSSQIILYVAAQNVFGLLVLAAGQINTASFYFLAQATNISSHTVKSVSLAVATVCIAGLSLFLFKNYLGYLYGDIAEPLKELLPLIILAAMPFVVNQIAEIRFFVSGRPWLIAISACSFSATFAFASYLAQEMASPMQHIFLGLAAGYLLQLTSGVCLFWINSKRTY